MTKLIILSADSFSAEARPSLLDLPRSSVLSVARVGLYLYLLGSLVHTLAFCSLMHILCQSTFLCNVTR